MPKVKKLKLEKGSYQAAEEKGLTLSEYLEELDPSEQYANEKNGLENMDAFQRQLAALELNPARAELRDFFTTFDHAVLFPEFVDRQIRKGLEADGKYAKLSDITALETTIDRDTYKGLEVDLDNSDVKLRRVGEGGEFPRIRFQLGENSISVAKIGFLLEGTYEALQDVEVPVIANALEQSGMWLRDQLVYEALLIALNGDGNTNPATSFNSAAADKIDYDDLVNLEFAFPEGHESSIWFARKSMAKKVYKIDEFKDAAIATPFMTKGEMMTPFGNILKLNDKFPDKKIIALDKKKCVQVVRKKGGSLVENDRLIDKEIEKTKVRDIIGFRKMYPESAQVLAEQ